MTGCRILLSDIIFVGQNICEAFLGSIARLVEAAVTQPDSQLMRNECVLTSVCVVVCVCKWCDVTGPSPSILQMNRSRRHCCGYCFVWFHSLEMQGNKVLSRI